VRKEEKGIWALKKGWNKGKADWSSCFAKAKRRGIVYGGSGNQLWTGCCLSLESAELGWVIRPKGNSTGLTRQEPDSQTSSCKKSVTPESSIQIQIKVSLKML